MLRWLFTICAAVSLILCVLTAAMWVRSFRVLDRWSGEVAGRYFQANSINGHFDVVIHRRYRLRAGVGRRVDVLRAAEPFSLLQETGDRTLEDRYSVTRSRWPLGDTDRWERRPKFFPAPSFRRWLAPSRDGWDNYVWATSCRVPYWSTFVAFALGPALFVARAGRRRHSKRGGRCLQCGYDLRATPDRCPECGTPAAGTTKPAVDAPDGPHSGVPASSQTIRLPSASAAGTNVFGT